MAHAELVEDVRIGCSEIDECVLAQHEALEHGTMNEAFHMPFVRPQGLEARRLDGRGE